MSPHRLLSKCCLEKKNIHQVKLKPSVKQHEVVLLVLSCKESIYCLVHQFSLISAPHFPRCTSASRPALQHAVRRSGGGARCVRASARSNEIMLTSRLVITAANRRQQSSSRPENKQADVITHRRGHAASTSHVVSGTRRCTRCSAAQPGRQEHTSDGSVKRNPPETF